MPPKINQAMQGFKSFFVELKQELCEIVQQEIEKQLENEVSIWLYRSHHERRSGIKGRSQAYCQGCGSQEARHFMRNGHRKRQLVSNYGVLSFCLPRVLCDCGGSVKIPFSILEPYQQIWHDVALQINRWADLGLSLRQMQGEIGEQIGTQVGLRTLNEQVQNVAISPAIELTSVPPVIMLDAIWVTLLEDSQNTKKDSIKRQRRLKTRRKVCVLVALGLYPQSGRWGILGWQVAHAESQEAWEKLLLPLEERGLYRQRGLELFIHDGGKGLIAALNFLYPNIPHQRCTFHKLRNLWHSIQSPQALSSQERSQFKRDILQQVQSIFYASDEVEAQALRDEICRQYRDTQAKFVATLQRDWHETIAFFRVLKRFPQWRRSALRSTSLLERVNRMLRRLFRPAGAFHSLTGLLASIARVLNPKCLI
jgi:putative transposase